MVDFELLKLLRSAGVKHARFADTDAPAVLIEVEFFETKAPGFGSLDFDTLIPPAHDPQQPDDEQKPAPKTPPALARLLKEGNVS